MDGFDKIREIIEPVVADYEYEIVRLKWIGADAGKTLQIMVEPNDGGRTDIDTCGKISSDLSAIFDVEDIIADKYLLEVTSPGMDRPLTRLKDFERFAGMEAKLETKLQIDGKKKFKGKIGKIEGEEIELIIGDNDNMKFKLNDINEAKLLLTDELVRIAIKESKN
jgi:ribosome maturation factor RimP